MRILESCFLAESRAKVKKNDDKRNQDLKARLRPWGPANWETIKPKSVTFRMEDWKRWSPSWGWGK
jgi:hypothetical protein